MKRLFSIILIAFSGLFFPNFLQAQPTLTAANTNLQPGDAYLIKQIHNAYYPVMDFIEYNTQVGANQVWNFSAFTSVNNFTVQGLSRANAPFAGQVPGSNVVLQRDPFGSPSYLFIENNAQRSTAMARGNWNNYLYEFIRPYDLLRFPFTFNSAFTDSTVQNTMNQFGNQCTLTDSFHVAGVGYGTLITPAGTFNQVLLVRSFRRTFEDTCTSAILNSRDIEYSWYAPGIHYPVLHFLKSEFSMGYTYAGYYYDATVSGTGQEAEAARLHLQLFPNPAETEVTVQYDLKKKLRREADINGCAG